MLTNPTSADVEEVLAESARLQDTRARIQTIIDRRLVIEQAKGVIAEKRRIGLEEAYVALRAYARDNNQTIAAVCALVVDATNAAARRPA